jgi:hypothetical protein
VTQHTNKNNNNDELLGIIWRKLKGGERGIFLLIKIITTIAYVK